MDILLFLVGIIVGAILCYFILRERIKIELEKWKLECEEKIRRETLDKSRVALKGKIGEQLAPLLPMFAYSPSDARFIGSPIDYIVFDGYTEVMGKEAETLREVVFVDIKTGGAVLSAVEKKVKETIEAKRVRWETISLGEFEVNSKV